MLVNNLIFIHKIFVHSLYSFLRSLCYFYCYNNPTTRLTKFNMMKNNHVVVDIVVEDVKPKYETVFLPMSDPEENTTFENPNREQSGSDNLRRMKRKAKDSFGKSCKLYKDKH